MIDSACIVSDKNISEMFDMDEIVEVCRRVFDGMDKEGIVSPHKFSMPLPSSSHEYMRWMNSMPAYIESEGVVGIKWAGICSDNYKRELPKLNATIILNSLETGMPFAILDGVLITHYRTAASVLLAAEKFAPKELKTMTILGPGEQGRYTTLFLIKKYEIDRIHVLSRTSEGYYNFKKFIEENSGRENLKFFKANDVQKAVSESDVILASSSSKTPLLSEKTLSHSLRRDQFLCGLSGFYDVSTDLLNVVDRLVFDSLSAKKRIEDACGVNFSELNVNAIHSMASSSLAHHNAQKNLYLPVGISAMDIAMANHFYKKYKERKLSAHLLQRN